MNLLCYLNIDIFHQVVGEDYGGRPSYTSKAYEGYGLIVVQLNLLEVMYFCHPNFYS
jgi:hypothetical protein